MHVYKSVYNSWGKISSRLREGVQGVSFWIQGLEFGYNLERYIFVLVFSHSEDSEISPRT